MPSLSALKARVRSWRTPERIGLVVSTLIALVALYYAYRADRRDLPNLVIDAKIKSMQFSRDSEVIEEQSFLELIRRYHYSLNGRKTALFLSDLGLLKKPIQDVVRELDGIFETAGRELGETRMHFPLAMTVANNGSATTLLSCSGVLSGSVGDLQTEGELRLPRVHIGGGAVVDVPGVVFVTRDVPDPIGMYYVAQVMRAEQKGAMEKAIGEGFAEAFPDAIESVAGALDLPGGFSHGIDLTITINCMDQRGSRWGSAPHWFMASLRGPRQQ